MKPIQILIVEDELPAAARLTYLLQKSSPSSNIVHTQSIRETVHYLQTTGTSPDLIFMDIRLGDGLSFEIFNQVSLTIPVIFTTAYDEYAIKAFKVNSIDYLLKPIEAEDLTKAIDKFFTLQKKPVLPDYSLINHLIAASQPKQFFSRVGEKTMIIKETEVAYFYSEEGYSYAKMITGQKHIVEETLEEITDKLNAEKYFRISRSFLLKRESITGFQPYFNNRISVTLLPSHHEVVIVSREKVKDFKEWLKG